MPTITNPPKEFVRAYMHRTRKELIGNKEVKKELLSIEEVRRQLGWCLIEGARNGKS